MFVPIWIAYASFPVYLLIKWRHPVGAPSTPTSVEHSGLTWSNVVLGVGFLPWILWSIAICARLTGNTRANMGTRFRTPDAYTCIHRNHAHAAHPDAQAGILGIPLWIGVPLTFVAFELAVRIGKLFARHNATEISALPHASAVYMLLDLGGRISHSFLGMHASSVSLSCRELSRSTVRLGSRCVRIRLPGIDLRPS